MSSQTALQLTFDFLPHLPVIVQQHQGQLSSDAGLLPLRQFDQRCADGDCGYCLSRVARRNGEQTRRLVRLKA